MSSVAQQVQQVQQNPKNQIQEMLSKNIEGVTDKDKELITIVRTYKVVNKTELENLSKAFGNVLKHETPSGTS
jgi:chemotaxis signal transduction protein